MSKRCAVVDKQTLNIVFVITTSVTNVTSSMFRPPYNDTSKYKYIVTNTTLFNTSNAILNESDEIVLDTQTNLEAPIEEIKNNVRFKRNTLLRDTDWTQSIEAPIIYKQEPLLTDMRVYRQALRDMPGTMDPANVIYPTPPTIP